MTVADQVMAVKSDRNSQAHTRVLRQQIGWHMSMKTKFTNYGDVIVFDFLFIDGSTLTVRTYPYD